jgi:hypothetical protein
MKRIYLLMILVVAGQMSIAQKKLFYETAAADAGRASAKEAGVYNQYKKNPLVTGITFIKVDFAALNDNKLLLQAAGKTSVAVKKEEELHDNDNGISWFGRMEDETGIFFTTMNGQLASKFYMGNVPCLIVPYKGNVHLLVTYSNEVDNGICGTPHGRPQPGGIKEDKVVEAAPGAAAPLGPDDNCTMRVLWVVTAQAEPEIAMPLELAARMLQDESNLAYQQSLINYRMEIARVVRTTYLETTTNVSATAYGVTSSYPSDIINLSTGAGLLNNVPTLRDLYQADVVVMVRSQATNSAQGFYGIAYGVPNDPSTLNAGNAFALISTEFMIGGRFTFAHEIGHVQGARHDNNPGTPVYALGYIFGTTASNNRTIMAVGGSCNPPTGCRVQFFSTPLATFGGVPVGIAGSRDNARRINETAIQIKGHRITSTNLLLPAETYDDEILARHLATSTISTNNSNVAALAGSRVSMRAGNSVTLLPGFIANTGSVFTAYINSCGYVPTTDRVALLAAKNTVAPAAAATLTVMPNPTDGMVTVQLPAAFGNGQLELINLKGERLLQKIIVAKTGQVKLDLHSYTAGVYLIRVTNSSGKMLSRKIVKE